MQNKKNLCELTHAHNYIGSVHTELQSDHIFLSLSIISGGPTWRTTHVDTDWFLLFSRCAHKIIFAFVWAPQNGIVVYHHLSLMFSVLLRLSNLPFIMQYPGREKEREIKKVQFQYDSVGCLAWPNRWMIGVCVVRVFVSKWTSIISSLLSTSDSLFAFPFHETHKTA